MMQRLAAALLMTALASCGSATEANQMDDNASLANFAMSSSEIAEGKPIPQTFTCDGPNQSPQLSWDDPPEGTKSFALVVDDPDAPGGLFRHWAAYDISPETRSIPRGQAAGKQAVNGFGKAGYGGPCPPKGRGPHHYHFKLYALDVAALDIPADAKVDQVEAEARRYEIGMAELTGSYERK